MNNNNNNINLLIPPPPSPSKKKAFELPSCVFISACPCQLTKRRKENLFGIFIPPDYEVGISSMSLPKREIK
jgi:hypothetical protein